MIRVRSVGQPLSVHYSVSKTVTFRFFFLFDSRNVIDVKPCMAMLLIELRLFIPLSLTLTKFQDHSSVKWF